MGGGGLRMEVLARSLVVQAILCGRTCGSDSEKLTILR